MSIYRYIQTCKRKAPSRRVEKNARKECKTHTDKHTHAHTHIHAHAQTFTHTLSIYESSANAGKQAQHASYIEIGAKKYRRKEGKSVCAI